MLRRPVRWSIQPQDPSFLGMTKRGRDDKRRREEKGLREGQTIRKTLPFCGSGSDLMFVANEKP